MSLPNLGRTHVMCENSRDRCCLVRHKLGETSRSMQWPSDILCIRSPVAPRNVKSSVEPYFPLNTHICAQVCMNSPSSAEMRNQWPSRCCWTGLHQSWPWGWWNTKFHRMLGREKNIPSAPLCVLFLLYFIPYELQKQLSSLEISGLQNTCAAIFWNCSGTRKFCINTLDVPREMGGCEIALDQNLMLAIFIGNLWPGILNITSWSKKYCHKMVIYWMKY